MAVTYSALPPKLAGAPLVGSLFRFLGNPLKFLDEAAAAGDGNATRFRLANLDCYLIYDSELAGQVLAQSGPGGLYIKGKNQRDFAPILDNGIPISEGDFWRRQRSLVQPAFNHRRIATYAATITDYTANHLARWQAGKLNVHESIMQLTFAIICKCLFDADVSGDAAEVGNAVQVFLDTLAQRVGQPLIPSWLPTRTNMRMGRAIRTVNQVVERVIAQRRAEGKEHSDLLDNLLAARDELGQGMDDQQLRAEVKALFLAGNETTAIAITWVLYLVAQHPEVEREIVAELAMVLAGRTPTDVDLPQLKYLDMVVKEALRLYPPVWFMGREATRDTKLGNYQLRRGNQVFASQWVQHRDPRYFSQPQAFIPKRWEGGLERSLPKYQYMPFGGGPRICVGSGFAWLEAKLVLAMLYQRWQLELVPSHKVIPLASATLRPKDGVIMNVTVRN